MRNWLWLLISFAGLALAEPPARIEVVYLVTRDGSSMAEITERLEYANGNYQLTETWKGKGMYALAGKARRVSRGRITDDALRPEEFSDERSGRDTARAWFDWSGMKLTMQSSGARRSEPLPPNAQDRLSSFLALGMLPETDASSVSYSVIDGKGMSHHEYRALGRELVKTPAGEFDALKVERVTRGKDTAHVWLALDRWNLPVRVLVMDRDGSRYDQVATRISPG
jgi:hypothetical protein